jgi:exosortase/archaeosortase family protein
VAADDRERFGPRHAAVFWVEFLALFATFVLAASSGPAERWIHGPLNRLLVRLVSLALVPFGAPPASGQMVVFRDFAAEVVEPCNGLLPIGIYLAAVLAFPSGWAAKGWGTLLGVPAIFLMNLLRLMSLVLLGGIWPDVFEQVHIYVWQTVVVAFSLGIWVFWVERFVRARGARAV